MSPTPLQSATDDDVRLYVPDPEGWQARIKGGWDKDYCFYQHPGEDHYHLLVAGEIYLKRGEEQCCLACALRRGIVSTDRTFWQRGSGEVDRVTR